MRPWILLLAIPAVFSLAAAACSSDDDASSSGPDAAAPTPESGTVDHAVPEDASVDAVDAADAYVRIDTSPEKVACDGSPCAVEIATANDSACVRLDDGTVRCWGGNLTGDLGRGPDAGAFASKPAPAVGIAGAVQISASPGGSYCALASDGGVSCWGSNQNGVLGRTVDGGVDPEPSSPTPAPVPNLPSVTGVFIGTSVACGTLPDQDIVCWGLNNNWQMPNFPRDFLTPHLPTTVPLGQKITNLSVIDEGTVALTASADLLSWGTSGSLEWPSICVLGREDSLDYAPPGPIGLSRVSFMIGGSRRVCAISNGDVYCWGAGPDIVTASVYPSLVAFPGKAHAETIAVGVSVACATLDDGTAYCWGANDRGQLGGGGVDPQVSPVLVQGLAGRPVRMVAMAKTTCAILQGGAVQCWGDNSTGQLGTGQADISPHLQPQAVELAP